MSIILKNKHLLTGEEMQSNEIYDLLDLAINMKKNKKEYYQALKDKHLALIFDKPSLRTRFSFIVAMHELGGEVVESAGATRKDETPEDQMRVLQGYCHAVMIRTFSEEILFKMKSVAEIPLINGLSDSHHPCQILADLMTLKESFGDLYGLSVCYIGDGNNILNSLLLMAPHLGIKLNYCCPAEFGPNPAILEKAQQQTFPGSIIAHVEPQAAVKNCHAVYTDVWTSMGFDKKDESVFKKYQVNEQLMQLADSEAIFMHCMPMERGKEVSETLPDQPCSAIFQQSENRMHVQKALLHSLLS